MLADPFDVGDSGRMAVFADLAGAAFSVWQAGRHRGATVSSASCTHTYVFQTAACGQPPGCEPMAATSPPRRQAM